MTDHELAASPKHTHVWYADKTRADSAWKFLVYDAKGDLCVEPSQLRFSGVDIQLLIPWPEVTGVQTRKQAFASSLSGCFVGVASLFGLATGAMGGDHPIFYSIVEAAFYPLLYLLFSPLILNQMRKCWTVVSYRSRGEACEAWFLDAAQLRLGSQNGSSDKIRALIEHHLSRSPQSATVEHQLPLG